PQPAVGCCGRPPERDGVNPDPHQPREERRMKTYEVLAAALADHEVDVIFGIVGEANMMLVDTFVRNGGRYINPPREDGAVLAAFGYAHATGRLGVATVT